MPVLRNQGEDAGFDMTALRDALLSDAAPPAVGLDNQQGAATRAAREDHTHTARVQRAFVSLDANGEATWTFARPFTATPVITALYEEAGNGQPIVLKVKTVSTTAVTVKGFRGQTLPATLTLLTALISFNIFGGSAPTGVTVHLFAAEKTQ